MRHCREVSRACGTALGLIAAMMLIVGPSAAAATTGGTRLWTQRFRNPHDVWDQPNSVAASPDGSKVFVTGLSQTNGSIRSADYATVAYDTSTGTVLWVRRYNGGRNHSDVATAIAASPDGSKVFVTGISGRSYATVAY